MSAPIRFLLGESAGPYDGGALYVRRLAEALGAAGRTASVETFDGHLPGDSDVAVIDVSALPAAAGALAARGGGGALAGLVHHPLSLETGLDADARDLLHAVETAALGALDRIIVTSDHSAGIVAGLGVSEDCIAVVTPGTAPAPWRHRPDTDWDTPIEILCVGPVVPRKAQRDLIAALAKLGDLDWRLTCVGALDQDPAYAAAAQAETDAAGLSGKVTFLGTIDDAALDAAYRRAGVVALPSALEGYGMVLAEALARGIPVAASDYGPIPEFVPRDASILAPPGDVDALSKALRRVLFDAELRGRMAEAAWQAGQALPSWAEAAQRFAAEIDGLQAVA